jgi:dihydroorotate dehydrogenase subfamily 1
MEMEDRTACLRLQLAGLTLTGPCIVASSVLTGDMRRIAKAAECGAGAVSTKMAMVGERRQSHPDVILRPKGGGIVSPGDKRLSLDEACALVERARHETDLTIFGNLLAPADDESAWQEGAIRLAEAGAHAIELDISCPNVPGITSRRSVAQSPEHSERITRAVTRSVEIPVFCKLTAQVVDIAEIAVACERAGADGIVAINGIGAAPEIDIYGDGRPRYLTSDFHSFGTLTGAPLFPIACRAVAEVARSVSIPVVGCGGVSTWEEAVQMMMWGASAVQLCTSVLVRGFETIRAINRGMQDFMRERGYASPAEFVGAALKYVVPAEQIVRRRVRLSVSEEECNLCGRCLRPGICLALSQSDGRIVLDDAKCLNCGVCVQLCPRKAIAAPEDSLSPER